MKNSIRMAGTAFAAVILLSQAHIANAAEIKVLSANGMREVMEDLGTKFERASGHKLAITYGILGEIVKRVQDGEPADVVITPRQGINGLVKDGKVDAKTVTALAGTSTGVVVRKGAPKPDIFSPAALKRTLLAAKSITYADPALGGAPGIHFAKVLDLLGIANEMKPKTIYAKNAVDTGVQIANGKAEIGVGQLQQLVSVAGIDIVGPLPGALQDTIVFTAAIMAGAKDTAASKALINFLRTPEAAAVIKAKGMEPG